MTNRKALNLIALGLHPVLLGRDGDNLKRPQHKGWQTAVYTPADVARWPAGNNVGIRCGQQRDGRRALVVFDFDEDARRIFPVWQQAAARHLCQPLVTVTSGRGCHVYFYTTEALPGRTLAGQYAPAATGSRRQRLFKFIETLGSGRQVVAAGCRHPNGRRYHFRPGARYEEIPMLTPAQYQTLAAISQSFDKRPPRPEQRKAVQPARQTGDRNCLDYARRCIGTPERREQNGDIRFLGQGGLLITADGRGWYSFSDETGGGLAELITWHQAVTGGESC